MGAATPMDMSGAASPAASPRGSPSMGRVASLARFSRRKLPAAPSKLASSAVTVSKQTEPADSLDTNDAAEEVDQDQAEARDGTKLTIQAMELLAQSKCEEAEVLFQQALALNETRLGVGHVLTVASVVDCSRVLQFQGKKHEASRLVRMELSRAEGVLGSNHPNIALLLNDLANIFADLGQPDASIETLRRELAIREADCSGNSLDLVRCLHTLAHTLSRRGDNEDAQRLCQRALSLAESKLSVEHFETVSCLCRLGEIQRELGRRQGPQRIFQRAFAILQKRRMEHPLAANILRGLRECSGVGSPHRGQRWDTYGASPSR